MVYSLTAKGGGGGAGWTKSSKDGGCGGGASRDANPGGSKVLLFGASTPQTLGPGGGSATPYGFAGGWCRQAHPKWVAVVVRCCGCKVETQRCRLVVLDRAQFSNSPDNKIGPTFLKSSGWSIRWWWRSRCRSSVLVKMVELVVLVVVEEVPEVVHTGMDAPGLVFTGSGGGGGQWWLMVLVAGGDGGQGMVVVRYPTTRLQLEQHNWWTLGPGMVAVSYQIPSSVMDPLTSLKVESLHGWWQLKLFILHVVGTVVVEGDCF